MKNKQNFAMQVMEKPKPKVIPQIAKMVKRAVDHKTIEKIIHLTEEEEGID